MAADNIQFVVLDVGQGTGNFIEIYKAGKLVKTVLIDLGSESAKTEAGGPSVEYVVDTLKSMTKPEIDYIFLSHSDSDHINLLEDVLSQFDPPGTKNPTLPILTVNRALYGGFYAKYKKGKRDNVLKTLDAYMPARSPQSAGANATSFPKTGKAKEIHSVEGVSFYIIAGNAEAPVTTSDDFEDTPPKLDGFTINTMSLVVMTSFAGTQYVATGDATGVTLSKCNERITAKVKKDFLPFVMMVTAPHHGSERTTFNLTASTGDRNNPVSLKNVNDFIGNISARTLTSSAERVRRFKHPSAYLMSLFWPYFWPTPLYADPTLTAEDRHYYSAYFTNEDGFIIEVANGKKKSKIEWPSAKGLPWWYTVQTGANVFTNLYYDPFWLAFYFDNETVILPPDPGSKVAISKKAKTPPLGVAWRYTTDSAGSTTMAREVNRPSSLALRRKIIGDRNKGRAAPPVGVPAAPLRTIAPPAPLRRLSSPPPRRVGAAAPSGLSGLRVLI